MSMHEMLGWRAHSPSTTNLRSPQLHMSSFIHLSSRSAAAARYTNCLVVPLQSYGSYFDQTKDIPLGQPRWPHADGSIMRCTESMRYPRAGTPAPARLDDGLE